MTAQEAKSVSDFKNNAIKDPFREIKKEIKKQAKLGEYFAYFGRGVTKEEEKWISENGYVLEKPNNFMFRIHWNYSQIK